MVEVGTGTKSSRFITTEWPIEEGLTLGTTKIDGRETQLVPEVSNVLSYDKVGL